MGSVHYDRSWDDDTTDICPAKVSRARRPRRCATAATLPATLEPCASMASVHYDRSWGAGAAAAGASSKSDAASFALEQEDWLYPPDSLCDTPSLPRVETGSPYCAALSEGMPSPANPAQEEKHLLALFAGLDASVDFKTGAVEMVVQDVLLSFPPGSPLPIGINGIQVNVEATVVYYVNSQGHIGCEFATSTPGQSFPSLKLLQRMKSTLIPVSRRVI